MSKNVLMLGASGRFGRHAAEAFWNAGWQVGDPQPVAQDFDPFGMVELVRPVAGGPGTLLLTDVRRKGTVLGELDVTLLYRVSHSWTLRSSYYAMAVDTAVFGSVDPVSIRQFVTASVEYFNRRGERGDR